MTALKIYDRLEGVNSNETQIMDQKAKCSSNLAACYMNFVPVDIENAYKYAIESVRLAPQWSKAHARLACCLSLEVGNENVSKAVESYRSALLCAEKFGLDLGENKLSESNLVVNEEKKRQKEKAIDSYAYELRNNICRLLDSTRILAGPLCVSEIICCSRLHRYPSIRLAGVLQAARLASSHSHRALFIGDCLGESSNLLHVLVNYASIVPEKLDTFCCQRTLLLSKNYSEVSNLHKFVVGKNYGDVHPLAASAVGFRNLVTFGKPKGVTKYNSKVGNSLEKRKAERQRQRILKANACKIVRIQSLMSAVKELIFRNDTGSDFLIFSCLGTFYKNLVEFILIADDEDINQAELKANLEAILRAGIPAALTKLRERALYLDLHDHATYLESLQCKLQRHPLHPDNQIY